MTEICENKTIINMNKKSIPISNTMYKRLEQVAKALNISFENCISIILNEDLEYLRLAVKNDAIDDIKTYYNLPEINPIELKKAFEI